MQWSRAIGRQQLLCGRARKPAAPISDPSAELRPAHPLAFPSRVLGVLRGALLDHRGVRCRKRLVKGNELRDNDTKGCTVERNVVHREVQPVVVVSDPDETRADQGFAIELVGAPRLLSRDVGRPPLGFVACHRRQVQERQFDELVAVHDPSRYAIHGDEVRAPGLVAADYVDERGTERINVERTALGEHNCLVVRARIRSDWLKYHSCSSAAESRTACGNAARSSVGSTPTASVALIMVATFGLDERRHSGYRPSPSEDRDERHVNTDDTLDVDVQAHREQRMSA